MVSQLGPCVLVLVVYLKIKKNKFLKQKQVVDHPGPCVFLHMVGVKHVVVLPGPCVFLLVPVGS